MLKEKLYYQGNKVNEMREFRVGGQNMAEISIVVPRSQVSESKDSVVDSLEFVVENETSRSEVVVTSESVSTKNVVKKGVVATKKNEEIFLGELGTETYKEACAKNKFNPDQIDQALSGVIKTHKGYKFSIVD